jgi:DNA polymerase
MSADRPVEEVVHARLEWLRLLGVETVRRRPAAATAPGASAAQVAPRARDAAGPPARSAAGGAPPHAPANPRTPEPGGLPALQGGLFGEAPVPDTAGGVTEAGARHGPGSTGRGAAATPGASPLVPFLSRPAPAGIEPGPALAALREEIGDCRRCRLCERRTTIVFGVGNPKARLMFVGEGPGADEDAQGEPFVGRAGQLLTKIIEAMGLCRADVYIANIVKCRPPENRTPLPDEVATCSPFLFRQIAAIRPAVIVCLGTPAAQTLFGSRETITKIRGIVRLIEGIRVMPTFHPAYLLRNPAAKREVWEDMKQVMALLGT